MLKEWKTYNDEFAENTAVTLELQMKTYEDEMQGTLVQHVLDNAEVIRQEELMTW